MRGCLSGHLNAQRGAARFDEARRHGNKLWQSARVSAVSTAGIQFQSRTLCFRCFATHLIDNLLARLRCCGTLDGHRQSTLHQRERTVLAGCLDLGQHLGTGLGTLEMIGVIREALLIGRGVPERIGLGRHGQCRGQDNGFHGDKMGQFHCMVLSSVICRKSICPKA